MPDTKDIQPDVQLAPVQPKVQVEVGQQLPQYDNELTTLNLGPTHPATHGVFQNILQMDGERIISGVPTIGYITAPSRRLPNTGRSTRSRPSPTASTTAPPPSTTWAGT
jgi:hypothetical protein